MQLFFPGKTVETSKVIKTILIHSKLTATQRGLEEKLKKFKGVLKQQRLKVLFC